MTLPILTDGFAFLEGPRWHEDALWFSDMHQDAVFRCTESGQTERLFDVPHRPSGLGWLPDGDLLVASMMDRTVYRHRSGQGLKPYASLADIAERRINDMLVDAQGRAWVGNFGFVFDEGEAVAPGTLARIDPDGTTHSAASGLLFANGMVMLPGTQTLVVAETYGARLTAFDIGPDGTLTGQRVWAPLGDGAVPDGLCVDQDGAIWVASPTTGTVLRVKQGGEVTETITTGRQAIACALGGASGTRLFISTAASTGRTACQDLKSARIEVATVTVPGPVT